MSTYNGERYLKDQLDSILSQQDVDINLFIRDDGSTDKTTDIIKSYKDIHLIKGANIGCEASFMELIHMKVEADYYAFADQDDVWFPRKLISAINNINQHHCDLAVCNLMLVDSKLNQMGPLFTEHDIDQAGHYMKKYAMGNIHGCVQVWTRNLHKIIQTYRPIQIEPHDAWVNAIANIVSSTFIDKQCLINYRLHGNNVSGFTKNKLQKLRRRLALYLGKKHPQRDVFCQQLICNFGSYLDKDDSRFKTILLIANYKKNIVHKLKLCFSDYIRDCSLQYKCFYILSILLNKY